MEPPSKRTSLVRGKGGKVLIVADDLRLRTLLAAFLSSMGPRCVASDSGRALACMERESFDVVLVDSRCSETPAEQLLLAIESLAPQLWGRVMVISEEEAEAQSAMRFQMHFLLPSIPRSRVFQQLWPSLQPFFAFRGLQEEAPQWSQIGRLIFDSFQQQLPSGMRSPPRSARQLVYAHEKVMVDMMIEPLTGLDRIALGGQVVNAAEPESRSEMIPVMLIAPRRPVLSTTTNRFGEFNLEFDFVERADLRIGAADRFWMSIPSIDMAWAKGSGMSPAN